MSPPWFKQILGGLRAHLNHHFGILNPFYLVETQLVQCGQSTAQPFDPLFETVIKIPSKKNQQPLHDIIHLKFHVFGMVVPLHQGGFFSYSLLVVSLFFDA
jgi:hypothetical protein